MSSAERKSDVQGPSLLTSPCLALPFGCSKTGTFQQWSHVNDIDHYPKPLKCDRLQRLPPPRSLSTSCSFPPFSASSSTFGLEMDPSQKVQQLERSLAFVRENHAVILHSLHKEIEELKKKNRELQFQLIVGTPSEKVNQAKEKVTPPEVSSEAQQKDRLEKEIKKLRTALKEALKTNANLTNQLEFLKREYYLSSGSGGYPRASPVIMSADGTLEGRQRAPTPSGPSPRIDEYSETLRQIQRAAGRPRNGRSGNESRNGEWVGYSENKRGYSNHSQQGRLPRLPFRNHQNVSPQQFDIPYRERSSNTLPALKQPLFPLMDRGEKPRKPRGPHRAKVADNISNH